MSFHRMLGSDEYVSCLTCGGMWEDATDGYRSADGERPVSCTGDTSQVHGYVGEQRCDRCDKGNDEGCEHVYTDCNCLLCDS